MASLLCRGLRVATGRTRWAAGSTVLTPARASSPEWGLVVMAALAGIGNVVAVQGLTTPGNAYHTGAACYSMLSPISGRPASAPDTLELREIDRPRPARDEVLVRVRAVGVGPGVRHLPLQLVP